MTKLQVWQKNPANVQTKKVQYWRNGIMLTAQMDQITARGLVEQKKAFVISEQAIGALNPDGTFNS